MRALVADDDRSAAEVLSRILTSWNLEVTDVADGAEAYRYLQAAAEEPTLAILDWTMPHLDGPEVCRRVRKEIPFGSMYLLLTWLDHRRDAVTGLDAGAAA